MLLITLPRGQARDVYDLTSCGSSWDTWMFKDPIHSLIPQYIMID